MLATTGSTMSPVVPEGTTTKDGCRRKYYRARGTAEVSRATLHRGQVRSWAPEVPEGARRGHVAWTTRQDWMAALSETLDGEEGQAVLARAHVKDLTVLDVAAIEAQAADGRTGRGVTTSHETVAKMLGCAKSTVRRARDVIAALGFSTTVLAGRHLSNAEREQATGVHGGRQSQIASTRDLVMPRRRSDEHLTPSRGFGSSLASRGPAPRRAARAAAAAPRQRSHPRPTHGSSIAVQRLAAGLAARLPWLAEAHVGHLCRALKALRLDDEGWTVQQVIDALDLDRQQRGLYSVHHQRQRSAVGLFVAEARRAGLDHREGPRALERRRRERLAEERREREAAQAARDEAAADAEQARAHIAQMRAQLLNSSGRHLRRPTTGAGA